MDPWKRYRLLAYIVAMLGMLVVGGWARLRWEGPEPYVPPILVFYSGGWGPRSPDPFVEFEWYQGYWEQRYSFVPVGGVSGVNGFRVNLHGVSTESPEEESVIDGK